MSGEVAAGEGGAAPILVTGTHYSATTWVGRVLARAPRVAYLHEPFNPLSRPGPCRARFPYWYTHLTEADGRAYLPALADALRFRYNLRAELASLRGPKDAARMARDAAAFARWRLLGARPLVKDPIALLSAEWLAAAFGMRVVVTVRHPAAFAHSFKRRGDRFPFGHLLAQPALMAGPLARDADEIAAFAARPPDDPIDAAGFLWRLLAGAIADYRGCHPDWLFVRHEDLARDPEARFREVFAAVDLPFTPAARRFVAATTAAKRVETTRVRRAEYVRRDTAAVAGRWRRELSAEEIARVRRWTEPVAGAFYAPGEW